jgi:L-fuconolactonase
MIDAHVHFWRLERGDYGWLGANRPVLNRDFLPKQLGPLLEANDVKGVIAVQAAPTYAETEYLLQQYAVTEQIVGVVGWVDLAANGVGRVISDMQKRDGLVGMRSMAGVHHGDEWLSGPQYSDGFAALEAEAMPFDALLRPHQIAALCNVAARHPGLPIVVDHAAKPEVGGNLSDWRRDITALSTCTNVFCKISGLTAVGVASDFRCYEAVVSTLLDTFGTKRLIWGSDHPVLLETSDYHQWCDLSARLFAGLDFDERDQINSRNARQFYRMEKGERHA